MYIPSTAGVPDDQRTRGSMLLRYEEVDASGFLKTTATPQAFGVFIFRELWAKAQLAHTLRGAGILAILSRLQGQSLAGPISIASPLEVEAWYQLAYTREATGEVQKLFLLCGADLYAPKGSTHPPQPEGAGTRLHVGRVFGEHVFTRPLGPPELRKVTSFDLEEPNVVLGHPYAARTALSTLDLPDEAHWTAPAFRADDSPTVFSLGHTDPNHHVNSLVYPVMFEDAAFRAFAAQGVDIRNLRMASFDVAYRKPCFPGENLRIQVRTFEQSGQLGAVAYLAPEGVSEAKSHTLCAMTFARAED